jgi:hypothetical protein
MYCQIFYCFFNLVPRAFLVVARELRKTLVKYDEISKILGDLSHTISAGAYDFLA